MGFTLTIEGSEKLFYGENIISGVQVNYHSPSDSRVKSTNTWMNLIITGKLTTGGRIVNSDTIKLYEWAQVSAGGSKVYSKVTVDIIGASNCKYRTITLNNAFIEDYKERHNAYDGVGYFTLEVRQKADKIYEVTAESST